jgi:hypothetical protein
MLRPRYGYRLLAGLMVAGALLAGLPAQARASDSGSGTGFIYYTVYSPAAIKKIQYAFGPAGLLLGTPHQVAVVPSADGIISAPDGSLLVGGGAGVIYRVDPATGKSTAIRTGGTASYHLALDPSKTKVWTAGLPGPLSEIPLDPIGPGTARPLHGDDTSITSLAFTPSGQAFYTASSPGGSGNFGIIDMTTMTTHRSMTDVRGVHGLLYDPYTHDLILMGGYEILQVDPVSPGVVVSARIVPGALFDQGIVDGQGHLFAASNLGQMVYVDYSATNLVGDTTDVVTKKYVEAKLDDLAPFPVSAAAVRTAAKSGSNNKPRSTQILELGGLAFLVLGGGGAVVYKRRANTRREFP